MAARDFSICLRISAPFAFQTCLFFRGTLARICETSLAFAAVSAQVFASEHRDLASQLASYNFLSEPTENTKAEVAAGESFRLAGPTGLEPIRTNFSRTGRKWLIS
jgi:hypothetical protein